MNSGRDNIRMILIGVAVVYGILFVLLNNDEVSINFVLFTATTSVLVGFLLMGAIGFLIGYFLHARQIRNRIRE